MIRFGIQRTPCQQLECGPSQAQFFDGKHWSSCYGKACVFTYDEAISRIIVMNVVDPANRYEVMRIENNTGQSERGVDSQPLFDDLMALYA